ncbi:cysteine--tRNA ligase [bacterium]|nr:cysteine--tRNA ligase [bacterium]
MAQLRLYNSLTNRKEDFSPIDNDHVKVYTCGPTVYNFAHIGNARPPLVSDILVRLLKQLYKEVTYVSNITDIDDKIIATSIEQKVPIAELTKKYENVYNQNLKDLGVAKPDHQPRATDHIQEMIVQIKELVDNGHAYISEGHVLFSVKTFPKYGQLSGRDKDQQLHGSRVEVASYKNDPADFILWKPSTSEQPGWVSPWGFGRPGWHLECSAMSQKTLGVPFDIHSGGQDLIFPHHENELAQSCGAHGKIEDINHYAKYWLHNGMIKFDGDKMSKSLGNIVYINDLLKKYNGEVLRLVLLSTHYRQPLNWSKKSILQSQKMLDKMYRTLYQIDGEVSKEAVSPPKEIIKALCDDLNTPQAIGKLNILFNDFQHAKGKQKNELLSQIMSGASLLGLLNQKPENWLGYQNEMDSKDLKEVEKLIMERDKYRSEKNYKMSDQIRDELTALGIEIEDSPQGTKWRKT